MGHAWPLRREVTSTTPSRNYARSSNSTPDNAAPSTIAAGRIMRKGNLDAQPPTMTRRYASIRNAPTPMRQGIGWHTRGDLVRANVDLTSAIRLQENSGFLFYDPRTIKQQMHDVSGAISDYGQAISSIHEVMPISIRGVGLEIQGQLNRAIADYGRSDFALAAKCAAYHNRGNARAVKRRDRSRHRRLRRGAPFDQSNAETFANRGKAYCMQGDFKRRLADSTSLPARSGTIATLRCRRHRIVRQGPFAPGPRSRPQRSDKVLSDAAAVSGARPPPAKDAVADLKPMPANFDARL